MSNNKLKGFNYKVKNDKEHLNFRNLSNLKSSEFRKINTRKKLKNNKTLNFNNLKKNLNLINKISNKRSSVYITNNLKNNNLDLLKNLRLKNNFRRYNNSISFKKLIKRKKNSNVKKNINVSKISYKTKKKEIKSKNKMNSITNLKNNSNNKNFKKIYENFKNKKLSMNNIINNNKIKSWKFVKNFKMKILYKTNNSIIKLIKKKDYVFGISLDKKLFKCNINNFESSYIKLNDKPRGLFSSNDNIFVSQDSGFISIFNKTKIVNNIKISKSNISHFYINNNDYLFSINDNKYFNTYSLAKEYNIVNSYKHDNIFTSFYYKQDLNSIYLGDYFGKMYLYDPRSKFIHSKIFMNSDYQVKQIKNKDNYLYIWDKDNNIKSFDIRNNKEIYHTHFNTCINNLKIYNKNIIISNNSIINLEENFNIKSHWIKDKSKIYDFIFFNEKLWYGGFNCELKLY